MRVSNAIGHAQHLGLLKMIFEKANCTPTTFDIDTDNREAKCVQRRTKKMRPPKNQEIRGLSAEKVN
jgi:hypothetical protein